MIERKGNITMKMTYLLPMLCLVLMAGARAEDGGSLKGTVKVDGDVPEMKPADVPDDQQAGCKCKTVADESLVVDKATKGLKWAIIRIQDAKPKDEAPKAPAYQLDQKGCAFSPHVVVVPPGTDLSILNPDKIMHNIHTLPYDSEDPPQNSATRENLTYKAKWLKDPDLIQITCDIHKWMKGFIVCHDPRYCAVSGADGTFEIKNLPAGKYKVNIWHEKCGNYQKKETIDVEIKAGAATDLGELKMTVPKK